MTYEEFWKPLTSVYETGEAKAIARLVMEVRYGLNMTDIVCGKTGDEGEMKAIQQRLMTNEPVQYVLGQADFCGRTFHVEPGVLIPRPETEHLCRLITESVKGQKSFAKSPGILDIGSGSGCIAITLALDIPNSHVTAWDISPIALRITQENARRLEADVTVKEVDILTVPYSPTQGRGMEGGLSLIVSNPPYICDSEADQMEANVLDYEPELALFVPDDDPLKFYVPIMNYAQSALHPGGQLWLETNPLYEEIIEERLLELGFDVTAHDDQFGKTRFIQAIR